MAALVGVQSPSQVVADEQPPELALQAYVEGLRTGSLRKLQELFLPDGQICFVSADPRSRIVCEKFSEALPKWVSKPDPLASGRVVHRNDATSSMSAVTYELNFAGTRYLDQLLLYRVAGRWQVVAKTTTTQ